MYCELQARVSSKSGRHDRWKQPVREGTMGRRRTKAKIISVAFNMLSLIIYASDQGT